MGVLFRSDMIIGFFGLVSRSPPFRLSIRLLDEHNSGILLW